MKAKPVKSNILPAWCYGLMALSAIISNNTPLMILTLFLVLAEMEII